MTTIANMKLIDYETIVQNMSKENSSELVDNDTVEHAKILVSELVNSSKESIKLYTNSFCENFYLNEKVLKSFEEAANRNVKFYIIAETNVENNTAINKYKELFNSDSLVIKDSVSEPLTMENLGKEITLNNFMIIDDKGIRYEQENKKNICQNIQNIKARGTFNRKEDVKPFVEVFNKNMDIKDNIA